VRFLSRLLIGVGVLLMILAGVWRLAVPPLAIKLPDDLDKTAHATGTFTLFLNPATKTPIDDPQSYPLDIERRLHVASSTSKTAVLKEDDVEVIKGLPDPVGHQTLVQQYVLDRRSMKDVDSDQAYAYSTSSKVDRSPAYSVQLPFDTGKGPYQIWKNEAGRSYAFTGEGTTHANGITVQLLHGTLKDAKVEPYYIDTLSSVLPKTLTPAEAAAQLESQGVDATALTTVVLPQLDPADRAEITSILAQPVNLKYTVDVDTHLGIEQRTGAIVNLRKIDQTIYVSPDVTGIGRAQLILAEQKYAGKPVVVAASQVLNKLVTSPPRLKAYSYAYSQTPASVADISSYAKDKGDQIDLVQRTVPLVLLIAGGVVLVIGLALLFVARRRRPDEPALNPREPQPIP
jgi:hypothetical protein